MIVCERHAGAIDLVLTDVVMPLMSGVELADRLRAMRPGLRVLFMSGYPDERGASRTVSITKLPKPFTPDSLLQQVRNALAT
jgi:DNA-binding NtrC family response regulator